MEIKDAAAVAFLVALACAISLSTAGFAHFLTAESYAHAMNVERAILGEATSESSLFYGFFAFAYGIMSGGQPGVDLHLMEEGLRLMPVLFAAAAAVSAYYSLRMKFGVEISAAATFLFLASLPFASTFMSNVVSPTAFGIALFMAGFALFATLRKRWEVAVAGGALVGLSLLAWNGCVLAYLAFSLGLVAELAYRRAAGGKTGNFAKAAAAMVAVPLPFLLVSDLGTLPSLLSYMEFAAAPHSFLLIAPFAVLTLASAIAKAMKKRKPEKLDVFVFASALFSFTIAPFSTAAALPGFALACAVSLRDIPVLMSGRNTALAGIFALAAYFGVGALAMQVPIEPALLIGLLFGAGVAFAASMYEGKLLSEYVRVALLATLAVASLSSVIALSHYKADPVSSDVEAGYLWIRENTPQDAVIGVVGGREIAAYITQREVSNDSLLVPEWLLGRADPDGLKSAGIGYVFANGVSAFDNIEALKAETGVGAEVRLDSFAVIDVTYDEDGSPYLVFQSVSSGLFGYLPITQDGSEIDTMRDAILVDPSGGSRRVAAARFVLLEGREGQLARVILPYENYGINLFRAFFGEIEGFTQEYPDAGGAVRVFKVG